MMLSSMRHEVCWRRRCLCLLGLKFGLVSRHASSNKNVPVFPPSQYMTQRCLIVGSHSQIETYVLLIKKMFGPVSIFLLRYLEQQTINSTVQSRDSLREGPPEIRWSIFNYPPGISARWTCSEVNEKEWDFYAVLLYTALTTPSNGHQQKLYQTREVIP